VRNYKRTYSNGSVEGKPESQTCTDGGGLGEKETRRACLPTTPRSKKTLGWGARERGGLEFDGLSSGKTEKRGDEAIQPGIRLRGKEKSATKATLHDTNQPSKITPGQKNRKRTQEVKNPDSLWQMR